MKSLPEQKLCWAYLALLCYFQVEKGSRCLNAFRKSYVLLADCLFLNGLMRQRVLWNDTLSGVTHFPYKLTNERAPI